MRIFRKNANCDLFGEMLISLEKHEFLQKCLGKSDFLEKSKFLFANVNFLC